MTKLAATEIATLDTYKFNPNGAFDGYIVAAATKPH